MTITLKPDLEEELAARAGAGAGAKGLTTEEFVNRVLERLVAQEKPAAELSAGERARILEEWTESHAVDGPPLSDYAVSRESIYSREDEML